MNIHGIKKHIQETKRDLNKKKNWDSRKLLKRLRILKRVLKSKQKRKLKAK